MARRESMIFYASWLDAMQELPTAVRNEAQNAILEYGIEGTMPADIGQTTKALMALIKPQIDANHQKYENGCKGGEYGVLGGRPKKKPQENPKKTPPKPQENPTETPNDNVYDNDNNNPLSLSPSPYGEREDVNGGVTATERERFFEIFYFRNTKHPAEEVERFINHYEASGWRRNGSNRKVSNKYALAKSWKFEDSTPRYDSVTASYLKKIEPALIEIGEHNIVLLLHQYLRKIEQRDEGIRICVTDVIAAQEIDKNKEIITKYLKSHLLIGVLNKNN